MDETSAVALLSLAEEVSPDLTGSKGRESLDRLETRSEDLLAAVAWFVEAGRADEALRLANALYHGSPADGVAA